jgi:hypothetical protein
MMIIGLSWPGGSKARQGAARPLYSLTGARGLTLLSRFIFGKASLKEGSQRTACGLRPQFLLEFPLVRRASG